jgi:hypothetical protein
MVEKVTINLEKMNGSGAVVMVVRAAATKVSLYTGSVVKGVSQAQEFGNKP